MNGTTSTLIADQQQRPTRNGRSLGVRDRLLVLIVTVALAGTCFLISAGRGVEFGQRAWKPGSALQVITELMSLQHEYPTRRGIEVKQLVQGLAAPAVLMVAVAGWYVRTRRETDTEMADASPGTDTFSVRSPGVIAAQVLFVLFALWMAASALWSPWPAVSVGESTRQAMLVIYAVALGCALSRPASRAARVALVVVFAATAVVGIWYYYERNPGQRLKFPIGNPIFLAACLIPGITLAASGVFAGLRTQLRSPTSVSSKTDVPVSWRTSWCTAGSVWALGIMCWAFWLTGSRGPLVGLACGAAVGVVCVVYTLRSRWIRYVIVGLIAIAVVAGTWWMSSQLSVQAAGRGATARLRLYTWEYAVELFAAKPLIGHGQAAYPLSAQMMSSEDMERDPIAFGGSITMHAHSEWLETAADLGSIGLALVVAALVITIVSAGRAFLRSDDLWHRACLLGLLAALVALIAEEMFNVALRIPGLPLVFYTVLGLIWAMSRDGEAAPIARGRSVRVCVLAGAVAVSAAMAVVAVRDWQGALAHLRMSRLAEEHKWDKALQQAASRAMKRRLAVDDRLMAFYETVRIGQMAARSSAAQALEMVERLDKNQGLPARIVALCAEDSERFAGYAQIVRDVGTELTNRMPGFPYVADMVADTLMLQLQLSAVRQQLGLAPLGESAAIQGEVRYWREIEYRRNRLNADAAMRLLPLWRNKPLADRIELIRIPLRSGPSMGFRAYEQFGLFRLDLLRDFKPMLVEIAADPELETVMRRLLVHAVPAADDRDPYAPETLRLAAVLKEFHAAFEDAAGLAAEAARLSESLRDRFPYAVSCALIDQAGYALLAYPDDAQRAAAVCQRAIDAWPPHRDREQRLRPLRRSLALYELAAGNEGVSRKILASLEPGISEGELDAMIGSAAAELYETFLSLGPQRYPLGMERWLERALALVDGERLVHFRTMSVRACLRTGDHQVAWQHLTSLANEIEDESRFEMFFRSLLAEFPDHPLLERLISAGADAESPQSQPATRPAATQPVELP